MSLAPLQLLPPEEIPDRVPPFLTWSIRLLALVATASACYLSYQSMQTGSIPGCTAGSVVDCSHVISSRWSRWLEIPVGLLGGAIYASILVVSCFFSDQVSPILRRASIRLMLVLAVMAGGGALWFIGLQIWSIGRICSYCMVAHACGLYITLSFLWFAYRHVQPRMHAGVASGLGLLGLSALVGGQIIFPHQTFIVEKYDDITAGDGELSPLDAAGDDTNDNDMSVASADDFLASPLDSEADMGEGTSLAPVVEAVAIEATESAADRDGTTMSQLRNVGAEVELSDLPSQGARVSDRRMIRYYATQEAVNLYDYPHLGEPEADHVIVEIMDYTCHHCRAMYPILESARKQYGSSLVVVLRPIANSKECNVYVLESHPDHASSCDYVKLALGIWYASPEHFGEYHHWLMSSNPIPSVETATRYASTLIGKHRLDQGRDDRRLANALRGNHRVWHEVGGALPLLFVERHKMQGVPNDEGEFPKAIGGLIGAPPESADTPPPLLK